MEILPSRGKTVGWGVVVVGDVIKPRFPLHSQPFVWDCTDECTAEAGAGTGTGTGTASGEKAVGVANQNAAEMSRKEKHWERTRS